MTRNYVVFILAVLFIGCFDSSIDKGEVIKEVEFNKALADELGKMASVDQIAAYIPQGIYKDLTKSEWQSFKDSVFRTHQVRLKEIFDAYGFTGYDLVGEQGALNFWVMTQHSDHDPEFQKDVLLDMKVEVGNKNASASHYALLVDRVKLNTGERQIYGTQVRYSMNGQAYPKPLIDSIGVNLRRLSVGLEPIEYYLNRMTVSHFEMNREIYINKGVVEPKLYSVPDL